MHIPIYETHQDQFVLSTDPARLQLEAICQFLADSYWANDRPRQVIERSIENSLCFGMYKGDQQIGFARVVTDYAVFAWLCDVYIQPDYRGRGLGKWLVATILAHPELNNLHRWRLATWDAQELYRKFGFSEIKEPKNLMERISCSPTDSPVKAE